MLIILLASLAGSAMAAYTGLLNIPTAETVEPGSMSVELEDDGSVQGHTAQVYLINTEVGIVPRVEAGVDYEFRNGENGQLQWNGKYVFSVDNHHSVAMAIGTFSSFPTIGLSNYLVATKDFHSFRLHFGGMRIDGADEWFTGIDSPINERLILMADYTSGSNNYSSAGFDYWFNDRLDLQAGVLFANSDSDDLYTLVLSYSIPLRSRTRDNNSDSED
ncbi:MAG: hypothetical protein ABFD54_04020 [Armatimonadota bacterium]|nr:YjbH domain-containing protein [bacterium]